MIKCNFKKTSNVLKILYKENIQSLFVEGGSKTIQYFIDENLWDKAIVFTGQKKLTKGIKEPSLKINKSYSEKIGNDILSIYYPT